jgi:heterotetrameric sarcosine oxidase delta subunit
MLLIECPYCGPREETEFSCGGEAHIVDRRRPTLSPTRSGAISLHAQEPRGEHLEQWVHAHGCRRWFNVRRDTVTYKITAVYKVGESPPRTMSAVHKH